MAELVPVPEAASPSPFGVSGPSRRIASVFWVPALAINQALGLKDKDQTPGVVIALAIYAFAGWWLLKRLRVL